MIVCGFWSIAVNIMEKLQFLIFIFAVLVPRNVLSCNYRIYLTSFSILKIAAVRHMQVD